MMLLVDHTAVPFGVSINEITCSIEDAEFATCVKLSRVSENPVD